jgi:hypothetical protein
MNPTDDREITWAVARLQARVLALVGALLGGTTLFVMTALLLLKGGPQVGQHLRLLGQYFYGYTVTWPGAFVGMLYGAATGALIGWIVGVVYNLVADRRS